MKIRRLFIDIETVASTSLAWSPKTQYINPAMWGEWIDGNRITSIAYKADNQKTKVIYSKTLHRSGMEYEKLLGELAHLMSNSKQIITYNGDKFDLKILTTEMLLNNVNVKKNYRSIDLLKTIRGELSFPYNNLAYIAKKFSIQEKLNETLSMSVLNKKLANGEKLSERELKLFTLYNVRDVDIMVELVEKLKGFIYKTPKLSTIIYENNVCEICGEEMIKGDVHITPKNTYNTKVCRCGFRCRPTYTKEKEEEQ